MMIDIKDHAKKFFWNWKENAEPGVNFFVSERTSKARQNMKKIQRQNPGLRDLTSRELENMALLLYGPHAPRDKKERDRLRKRYYAVDASTTPPNWKTKSAGNPRGVAYVDRVRSNRK